MEALSRFDFTIKYRPGKEDGKPDILTRRKQDMPKQDDERIRQKERILLPREKYFEDINEIEITEFEGTKNDEIREESKKEDTIQQIKQELEKGTNEMKGVALVLCQWKDGYLWHQGKIWIPENKEIRVGLIRRHHNIPQSGHGGIAKTTEHIQRKYYWPYMRDTIKRYVKNCDICQRTKAVRHAPYGLMKPNQTPDRPWKSISIDFITDLPNSEANDAILIIVDRLTKMAHFIPCTKEINPRRFSELFMREIFRLHGLPKDIITDRGSIFTSEIWIETMKKLGIERRLSTAFLPQTDRQTERTNSTLEQYLRAYVNYEQDNWKELLPMAEFAYNNRYQESIRHTPFFANYGINLEHQATKHLIQDEIRPPENMSQLREVLKAEMTQAELQHKDYYDQHRKPDPNSQSEEMVWLIPRNIRTTRPYKKLDYKKIGPFKILAKIESSAYRLDLPPSMKIHNTFHISLL